MRIIILTDSSDRHFYLANKIIEEVHSVIGVITGAKKIHRSNLKKLYLIFKKKNFFKTIKNTFINIIFKRYGIKFNEEKKEIEKYFFKNQKKKFFKENKSLHICHVEKKHTSINNSHYLNIINEKKPDVIIVMGTCLVCKDIIEAADFVLNLHTGLSPYFKGGLSNFWPFIDNSFGTFGVTIHKMTLGVDSGDILYSGRPSINQNDNYASINSKSIILGVKKLIIILENLKKSKVKAAKQWCQGKTYRNIDYNYFFAYSYFKNRKDFIKNYTSKEKYASFANIKTINL